MNTNSSWMPRGGFEVLFREYGLPRVIRSDNGAPFATGNGLLGLSRRSAWWLVLGIDLDRIRPAHPEENGGHERMHRDIRQEIQGLIEGGLSEQQAALDVWRESFNRERPHEALAMKTPSVVYRHSKRPYVGTPDELVHGHEYLRRRVNRRGIIKIKGLHLFIAESLCGWHVGIKPIEADLLEVWFARLYLGTIDLTASAFLPEAWRRQER